MAFGLSQKTISQLKSVFKKYPDITQVKIYGSRARGYYKRGSDIDLAFFSESEKNLSSNLSWELDDLPSPYLFDLVDYNTLNENPLKEEIDKYGKVLYRKSAKAHLPLVKEKPLREKRPILHRLETKDIKTPKTDVSFTFKQTELGEVPEDWRISSVDEKYNFSKKPRDLNFSDFETISFIPMDMIPNDKIVLDNYAERKPEDISSGVYFESGDLLLSKITPSFENGKQCIVKDIKHGFGIATTEVIPIKEKNRVSDIRFLFYYLLLNNIRSQIAEKMEGATGRKRVPVQVIKALKIPFPSLLEQKKISGILFQIQRAIEIQDKLIEATKELKQSTMKQLFTYGVKRQKTKQTELGTIPKDWEVVTIERLFNLKQGKSLSSKNQTGLYLKPFLRTSNVFWSYLDLEKVDKMDIPDRERESLLLKKGDLLVCEGGDIGRTAIWNEELRECYYQNHIHRLRAKEEDICPQFYMYWMDVAVRILNIYGTFGNRTTIPNLSGKRLLKFKIPRPPLTEQEKISDILTKIDHKIQTHKKKKSKLEELFRSMLNRLMTGKIRVHQLNINTDLMR